ncbi:MAG: AAA family ATPase [Chloroflexi bacterium]|nr:AAA family ATPase [Chloroflexota bacterium]
MSTSPLLPDQLYQSTDPNQFSFETSDQVEDLTEIIGQPRAVEAISFGTGMQSRGYNIYALGPSGTGKRSLVTKYFQERAISETIPQDWCYVHNFDQDHKPKAIQLPPGMGTKFQADMDRFVDDLRNALSTAFESDEYRTRRRMVESEIEERQEAAFEELQAKATQDNFSLLRTPAGLVFAPVKDGEVIPPDDFKQLPEETRQQMEKRVQVLQKELQSLLQQIPVWQRELRGNIRELNHEITEVAVISILSELKTEYDSFPQVLEYLEAVQKDVVDNASRFLESDEDGDKPKEGASLTTLLAPRRSGYSLMLRYKVNLFVDNQASQGAPVIFEDNPTYQNLIGRVEQMVRMGALVTDFTLIKPGSLHLANGGYLVMDALKVLTQPYAWEALKRALETQRVRIESPGEMLGLLSTVSLEPQPVPLNVKIALLGDRMLYYLLSQSDPEFSELFKVQADFAEEVPRTADNQKLYARMIATLARQNELRPLNREAIARVIEHCARVVGDSQRLTIQVNHIVDLLNEADYWAGKNGNQSINAADIQKAIDARTYRADRVRERYQEHILRESIMISTQGSQVGQINGLSVAQVGDFSFGFPSRITASVRRGKGDVIDIEREVELSGPIHSKGVLILAGFLGQHYASDEPLSLSASLVFEQSYSGVEGDSASSAELYVLLSAISGVPIKQSLAVTGSVNQHGQVQAIGGVNEKIEGFFDICRERGLTGDQGVLIPSANVKHLMLNLEIRDAVADGLFNIYPISEIDQGIELLTGIPMGQPDQEGKYPPETISGRVQARLEKLAKSKDASGEDETGNGQ